MSWQTFKNNLVSFGDNPDNISDIDKVAKKWADEYDAAIKRGGDTINKIKIQNGNKAIMEQLFKAALQQGLTSTAPYDLVGEMGKGVLAYWQGAIMQNIPIPIQLPPGATANISVVSNVVINPGQWTPPSPGVGLYVPDIPSEPTELDIANDIDMPSAEQGDAPLTEEEVAVELEQFGNLEEFRKNVELNGIPELSSVEVEIIENPVVIDYDTALPSPFAPPPESTEGYNPPTDGNLSTGKDPIVIKNVGKSAAGIPPGYEIYQTDRSHIKRSGASKSDGPNGGIPYDKMRKVSRPVYGSGYLHPEAAVGLELFLDVCAQNNVRFEITPGGGWYRDYQNQIQTWNKYGASQAAVPGHSNHGWGIAIDIRDLYRKVSAAADALNECQTCSRPNAQARQSDLYKFFAANAPKFGWYNPAILADNNKTDEAWHWEYHGFKTLSESQRKQMIDTFNSTSRKNLK